MENLLQDIYRRDLKKKLFGSDDYKYVLVSKFFDAQKDYEAYTKRTDIELERVERKLAELHIHEQALSEYLNKEEVINTTVGAVENIFVKKFVNAEEPVKPAWLHSESAEGQMVELATIKNKSKEQEQYAKALAKWLQAKNVVMGLKQCKIYKESLVNLYLACELDADKHGVARVDKLFVENLRAIFATGIDDFGRAVPLFDRNHVCKVLMLNPEQLCGQAEIDGKKANLLPVRAKYLDEIASTHKYSKLVTKFEDRYRKVVKYAGADEIVYVHGQIKRDVYMLEKQLDLKTDEAYRKINPSMFGDHMIISNVKRSADVYLEHKNM